MDLWPVEICLESCRGEPGVGDDLGKEPDPVLVNASHDGASLKMCKTC